MSSSTTPTIPTSKLFLVGALVLLLVGFVAFGQLMRANKAKPVAEEPETRPLVVVAQPIQAGEPLKAEHLAVMEWPKDLYPDDTTVFESQEAVLGRTARLAMVPGEPLFRQKVAGMDAGGGLPIVIPKGYRAVSVSVTDVSGVAGFVKPGDRVDVLAQVSTDVQEQSVQLSKMILQNVLVLASEQNMLDERIAASKPIEQAQEDNKVDEKERRKKDKKASKPKVAKNVTLALTPAEAETLTLAAEMGNITLALRNEEDYVAAKNAGITETEVFRATALKGYVAPPAPVDPLAGLAEPTPAPAAGALLPSYSHSVEVYEGPTKATVNF